MAINFPDSPVNGDTHVVGNVTYVYDNAKAKWNGAGQTPNDRLTEGSNKLEIDGSNNLVWTGNNVGIGTTSPQAPLEVLGSTNGDQLRINQSGQFYRIGREGSGGLLEFYGAQSGFNGYIFGGANGERARIDSSGNFGIGTNSPSEILHIQSATNATIRLDNTGGTARQGRITTTNAGEMEFRARSSNSDGQFIFYGYGGTVDKERMRLDSSGRLLVGTSTTLGNNATLQTSGQQVNYQAFHYQTAQAGPFVILSKSRGTQASPTAVEIADYLGIIGFSGYDGTDYLTRGAEIACQVDGTPGANDMPGRLVFSTTADGASSPTERLRIKSNGDLKHTGLRAGGGENKLAILVTPSHNTTEEDVIVYQVENESSFNQITFGGGTASYNAATTLAFNTATAVDTTGGQRALAIDSSQNILYYGATGAAGGPGGTNVTKRADVDANTSLNIQIPGVAYVGHLYVMSVFNSNATVRTSRIYFISGRYGNSPVITQLQTDDGSNGGRSFNITDVSSGSSNLIQFTDTSNSSVEVSMHFVGAIGL